MNVLPRSAGAALLVYAVGTAAAFMGSGAPGGSYTASSVSAYVATAHHPAAFALWYVAAVAALGLIVLGQGLRSIAGVGGFCSGLGVAAAAVSATGAFVAGGVDVGMSEGGPAVAAGVPHPVVYVLTEIGNLLAVCGPALFVGAGAIALALRLPMATWLRVVVVLGGVCGLLAPFYFTYAVFELMVLLAGVLWVTRGIRLPEGMPIASPTGAIGTR